MEIGVSGTFYPLLENPNRYLLLYGGSGCGKSEFAGRKICYRGEKEGNHCVLMVRKVRKTLKRSCIKVILSILEENKIRYKYNKTDLVITYITGNGRKNEIIGVGLDDPYKLKSIKGITMVWMEETTEFSQEDFTLINLMLREPTPYYKQIMMTFNPDEVKAEWIKKVFFGSLGDRYTGFGAHVDSYIHHSTWKDNPIEAVRIEYEKVLTTLTDSAYVDIYEKGVWASPKGKIFHWPVEDLPSLDEDWYDEIFGGGDFGFSINQAGYVKIYRKALTFWVQEIIYELELTNEDLAMEIKAHPGVDPKMVSYWDSAEPKSIEALKRKGLNAKPCEKGQDSVRYGINLLQALDVRIVSGGENLIDERSKYKWALKSDGQPSGKPVKIKDHLMDACRYGIYTHYYRYLMEGYKKGKVFYKGMKAHIEKSAGGEKSATIINETEPDLQAQNTTPQKPPVGVDKGKGVLGTPEPSTKKKQENQHGRKKGRVYVP